MPFNTQAAPAPDDLLTPSEVAASFKLEEKTLANWRGLGTGPKFVKLGKRCVRYRRRDLEDFINGEVAA